LPWAIIGALAVGGIAVYDNWKSVKPMLAAHAPGLGREKRTGARYRAEADRLDIRCLAQRASRRSAYPGKGSGRA
jgi:hypothetical protein